MWHTARQGCNGNMDHNLVPLRCKVLARHILLSDFFGPLMVILNLQRRQRTVFKMTDRTDPNISQLTGWSIWIVSYSRGLRRIVPEKHWRIKPITFAPAKSRSRIITVAV